MSAFGPLAPGPSAALRERVLRDATQTDATPPGTWRSRVLVVAVFVMLWAPLIAAAYGLRRDAGTLPPFAAAISIASAVFAALVLSGLAVSRGRAMLGPSLASLSAATLLAPIVLGTISVIALRAQWPNDAQALTRACRSSVVCGAISLGIGTPLLVAFLWLRRGLSAAAPRVLGALAGVAAGAWAHGVLQWHCPLRDALHIILGHVVPALPLAALGALAVRHFAHGKA